MSEEIIIRPCTSLEDFDQCIALQQIVWGDSDRDLVPRHLFVIVPKTGGQVLGAFVNDRMVGYLLAVGGVRNNRTYLHSHMTAVIPEFQNQGIGRLLKLAQREEALARGIELIEWTFDPLKLRNAYFNIVRLGATVQQYLPDVYGSTGSHLDAGLPTDRFLAQWWINSERVKNILRGQPYQPPENCERVFVPVENQTLELQREIRSQFQNYFAQGYCVTSLVKKDGGIDYLLEPDKTNAVA